MHKRQGFLVDEATILDNGVAMPLTGGAKAQGLNIGFYFSANAAGTVVILDNNGAILASVVAPTGGGKVIIERGRFEVYDVTSVTMDSTGLTAGTVQASLY